MVPPNVLLFFLLGMARLATELPFALVVTARWTIVGMFLAVEMVMAPRGAKWRRSSAVCEMAIPEGEGRRIKELGVFFITVREKEACEEMDRDFEE